MVHKSNDICIHWKTAYVRVSVACRRYNTNAPYNLHLSHNVLDSPSSIRQGKYRIRNNRTTEYLLLTGSLEINLLCILQTCHMLLPSQQDSHALSITMNIGQTLWETSVVGSIKKCLLSRSKAKKHFDP